jgi:hypothetical protein
MIGDAAQITYADLSKLLDEDETFRREANELPGLGS